MVVDPQFAGAVFGEPALVGSVRRMGARQGEFTVIPHLTVLQVDGVLFQPNPQYTFDQQAGATVRKRVAFYADWDRWILDAIAENNLNPVQPIEPGDIVLLPGIPPIGGFEVDDAQPFPGHYIKVYTATIPTHV